MKMINTILMILLLVSGFSCSQTSWTKHSEDTYIISYPDRWIVQHKGTALFLISPLVNENDLFQENINVMIQNLENQPMTLEEYSNLTKGQIIQLFGMSAIKSFESLEYAGQQACRMVYNLPKDKSQGRNFDLVIHQIWFIENNSAYLLTFTAKNEVYNEYLETVNKIFSSFVLK